MPRITLVGVHAYVGNNPMRRIDPNGKDWGDFFFGVIDGIQSNLSMGATDASGITLQGSVDNPSHYNSGRTVGDLVSIVMGAAEVVGGGTTAAGGLGISATGVGAVAGVPAVVAGSSAAMHGTTVIGNALKKEGRMSEMSSGDSDSKYKDIPNSRNTGDGKKFTPAHKKRLLDAN